jgi:hypothetical protein
MSSETNRRHGLRHRPWSWWILFGVLGAVLLAVVAAFGFSLWLNAYLHGDKFRVLVSVKTSEFLCASGQYMPFHWNGASVYSDGYAARGLPGAAFAELRADQIRAEFQPQGILHHAWRINELNIQRIDAALGRNDAARRAVRPATVAGGAPASMWAPNRLEVLRTQIQDVNLSWSNGALRQLRVVLEPEGQALVARGFGGTLRQSGWPVLKVDHVRTRFQAPVLFVTESLLKIGESENVNVTGQVDFDRAALLDLQVKCNGVTITPYLPVDWRARLRGTVSGESRVTGRWGGIEGVRVEGRLSLSDGVLEALPVLDQIALFTQTAQFRRLTLQKATAEFVWTQQRLTVSKLVMESAGLLRVEGEFVLEQGQVAGVFQVGVTPSSLRWLPGSQKRVFTLDRDGYVWTQVKVAGPVDNLKEDLSSRLAVAAGTEVIEGVKGTLEKGVETVIDVLKPLLP